MKRRSFFSAITAAVASCFGVFAVKSQRAAAVDVPLTVKHSKEIAVKVDMTTDVDSESLTSAEIEFAESLKEFQQHVERDVKQRIVAHLSLFKDRPK